MPWKFYIIMTAQFFSALADNALLIIAIDILQQNQAPSFYAPLLKLAFVLAYVLIAPFVGAFADSMPKGRVMFICNGIKIFGCMLMFGGLDPLYAFMIVGVGAAAYSPAKYGILTEYLPHSKLVTANSWIEALTVAAIIFGFSFGGLLLMPEVLEPLTNFRDHYGLHFLFSQAFQLNIAIVVILYVIAAIFNLFIPKVRDQFFPVKSNPIHLVQDFYHNNLTLWEDRLGSMTLGVTSLFWGVGAVMQFIVLDWSKKAFSLDLAYASQLQGVVALGIIVGAAFAGKFIALKQTGKMIPFGISIGLLLIGFIFIKTLNMAIPALIFVGLVSGFFIVPMNAMLQHRGHSLMGAGSSIAVQNFNENLSILVTIGLYALALSLSINIYLIMFIFGLSISSLMLVALLKHRLDVKKHRVLDYLEDQ